MREPERIGRILDKLQRIWHLNEDQRLGQLILNLSRPHNSWPPLSKGDTFNIEDDRWEELLDKELIRLEGGVKRSGKIEFIDRIWMVPANELCED